MYYSGDAGVMMSLTKYVKYYWRCILTNYWIASVVNGETKAQAGSKHAEIGTLEWEVTPS